MDLLKQMIGAMLGIEGEFRLVGDVHDEPNDQTESWQQFCESDRLGVLWRFIKEIIFDVTASEKGKSEYKSPFDKK